VETFLVEESQSTLPFAFPGSLALDAGLRMARERPRAPNLCRYLSARAWGKPRVGVDDLRGELLTSCQSFLGGRRRTVGGREDRLRTQSDPESAAAEGGNITRAAELLGMDGIASPARCGTTDRP